MPLQPVENLADAARRQRDACLRGAVVEIQRFAIIRNGVAAGKGDVRDVAVSFVRRFRSEDPFVPAHQQLHRLLEIEQRRA